MLYFLEYHLLGRNFSTYLRRICIFSALAWNSLTYNISLLFLFLDVLSIGERGNEVTYYCVLSYMRYIWFNISTSVCFIKFSVTTLDVCIEIYIAISCYWSFPLPIWRPSSFLMTFCLGMFVGMCFVLLDGFCHIDLEYWFASLHFGCIASFAYEVCFL